jgi:SAM-dependent methyltransferase
MAKVKDWFSIWFDSPYYHLLYKNRDGDEAGLFLTKLIAVLNLKPNSRILDLACGKGRHSIFLRQLGFNVTGIDLSPSSIKTANLYAQDGLSFFVQDMRIAIAEGEFDVVLNLFTSFGYFEEPADNVKVLQAVNQELKPRGLFLIDFMNSEKVCSTLVANEVQLINNTKFKIERKVVAGFIEKTIIVNEDADLTFVERVQALTYHDFYAMLETTGFKILSVHGSYNFESFDIINSDRLIIIAQKI